MGGLRVVVADTVVEVQLRSDLPRVLREDVPGVLVDETLLIALRDSRIRLSETAGEEVGEEQDVAVIRGPGSGDGEAGGCSAHVLCRELVAGSERTGGGGGRDRGGVVPGALRAVEGEIAAGYG